MITINVRDLFPEYTLDCYIEFQCYDSDDSEDAERFVNEFIMSLTKEMADAYIKFQRNENSHNRRKYYYKAHYSLDCNDGIENEAVDLTSDSPFEEYVKKLTKQQIFDALESLPEVQARRIYAHFFLGMKKREIAKEENVAERTVGQSIERGLERIKKILEKFM